MSQFWICLSHAQACTRNCFRSQTLTTWYSKLKCTRQDEVVHKQALQIHWGAVTISSQPHNQRSCFTSPGSRISTKLRDTSKTNKVVLIRLIDSGIGHYCVTKIACKPSAVGFEYLLPLKLQNRSNKKQKL